MKRARDSSTETGAADEWVTGGQPLPKSVNTSAGTRELPPTTCSSNVLEDTRLLRDVLNRVTALEGEVAELRRILLMRSGDVGVARRDARSSSASDVSGVAYSNSWTMRLAIGLDDGRVAVLDLATFNLSFLSAEHSDAIGSLSALGDGRLASASDDGSVLVWDQQGNPRISLRSDSSAPAVPQAGAICITHAADGLLVSGGEDKIVRVWSSATGQLLHAMGGHTDTVNACLSLPGKRIASCSSDRTVRIWSLESGSCERTIEGHVGEVHACALLPCEERIVTASSDGTVRVWNLATGACEKTIEAHAQAVQTVAMKDPFTLVSGGQDGLLKLWRIHDWQCTGTLAGHTDAVSHVVALDHGAFASSSIDGEVHIWSPYADEKIRVQCPATPLALALLRE